ncbi:hypothetical protein [Clostridium beijerinckii]|uniref:hypothetical protein n=1 Tax=Clostridium beijerinckii TaxID=1520 RepID=UPI002331374F|nr:hypothetical protein [Clostridium beijerinckii]
MFDKPDISIFPLGMNGYEVYDIVYLGDLIPGYSNSPIPKVLHDEYVFIFTTLLNGKKESCHYGNVKIDFMKHELLSCFNSQIREKGNIHVLGKENLQINDFLEIVNEKTEHGRRIIAQLKNQKIIKNHTEVAYTRDFRVLLVQENNQDSLDNIPVLELGPEFRSKLDWDRAKEQVNELNTASGVLAGLSYRNRRNPEDTESIKKVQYVLKKEIEEAKQKSEELFDNHLRIKKNLLYVHKTNG